MVERKQITLIYSYNDNWIGGTYYILNIIRSLTFLNEEEQPILFIVYEKGSDISPILNIGYKFIEFIEVSLKFNLTQKIVNKISKALLKRTIIKKEIPLKVVKNVYPIQDIISTKNVEGFYYWIPDFQEHYLPQYFSKKDLAIRNNAHKRLVKSNHPIVFSSQNAFDDYNKFYPRNQNRKEVLKFVSILDNNYLNINLADLIDKYSLKRPYFIVPNQFWKHKNHIIILKAIKILAQEQLDFHVVFTGKEHDFRHPEYVNELRKYIKDNDIENRISLLGFIDRSEQLCLMKNSVSVIQPSHFEGWSTVVEDTKAINHFIILSDINLHREQITENCLFFDPNNEKDLVIQMRACLNNTVVKSIDYDKEIIAFGRKFISIFN